MYKQIYVPVDNSDLSNAAVRLAIQIGSVNKSKLIGSHVYAAKLHDQRFRTMESGLPAQYHEENELEKQRKVHDSLITKGLELITDSYLGIMAANCGKADLDFKGVSLEGKNWQELVRDISRNDYDLIVMGAHGLGRVPGSLLGSVTERVVHRVKKDLLVVKNKEEENLSNRIVVCLDGSDRSYGALKVAMDLAVKFDKKIEAISAFDPYYHYVMFDSLNDVLTEKARKVFKFEEQEKLHEDIIDSGLAKVYQANLDIAKRLADDEKLEIGTKLLDGKAWQKILEYVQKDPPWLLVLGRTGIHNEEEIDLGSNSENILRMAPCNIFLTETKYRPPVEYLADETIIWTKEATAKMAMVPAMAKGVAMKGIQQHAVAEGHTMITSGVVDDAIRNLLPPESIKAMGIVFDEEKKEGEEEYELFSLSFECPSCKYIHHDKRPDKCPVCDSGGESFKIIDSADSEDLEESESHSQTTFDGRKLNWIKEAKEAVDNIADESTRKQLRLKLEKQAHTRRQTTITKKMVIEAIGGEANIPEDELQWTDEAGERLSRVPQGFMRNGAKRKIEEYAKEQGASLIDLNVAEAGLEVAKNMMMKSMKGGGMSHPASIPRGGSKKEGSETSKREGAYECLTCGYVVEGKEPQRCEACEKEDFSLLSEPEKSKLSSAAFKILSWDDEAKAILERAPEGFMRDMSKSRIEQWARKAGELVVTKEIVENKYASWKEGSAGLRSELDWSDEARERVDRIPDFIQPMVIKEIERQAGVKGDKKINAKILDSLLKEWGDHSQFHKKTA